MQLAENPRIILIGSVNSSRKTLLKLIEHDMNVVAVLGLQPSVSKNVSGYVDLSSFAEPVNIPFKYFKKVNDKETVEYIKDHNPDLLFVIGLSQLINKEVLSIPIYGSVGFHPTRLPEGRGRGAIAWLILGKAKGAASFFLLDEGMDSGPILAQEPFEVKEDDYAKDVITRLHSCMDVALDNFLPQLKKGIISSKAQDNSMATYLGRRKPIDGLIDWNKTAEEIYKLIRATSDPLPGAFTYYRGKKVIINKARIEKDKKVIGVPGRVLEADSQGCLVQTGEGLLLLTDIKDEELKAIQVGEDLGLNIEKEVSLLKEQLN